MCYESVSYPSLPRLNLMSMPYSVTIWLNNEEKLQKAIFSLVMKKKKNTFVVTMSKSICYSFVYLHQFHGGVIYKFIYFIVTEYVVSFEISMLLRLFCSFSDTYFMCKPIRNTSHIWKECLYTTQTCITLQNKGDNHAFFFFPRCILTLVLLNLWIEWMHGKTGTGLWSSQFSWFKIHWLNK